MWRKGICGGKAFTAETQRLETKDEGHRGNSHLTGDVVRRGKNAVRSMATANLVRTARREWLDWNPLQGTIRSYTGSIDWDVRLSSVWMGKGELSRNSTVRCREFSVIPVSWRRPSARCSVVWLSRNPGEDA